MAIKKPVHETCDRCGETVAEMRPSGIHYMSHRCANAIPGPQNVPYKYSWREAYFVAANGTQIFEPPDGLVEPEPPGAALSYGDKVRWLLDNSDRLAEERGNREPDDRPLLLFPSGKVRVQFVGTYDSVDDAYDLLRRR